MTDLQNDLLELEHAGWRSLCDGSGGDFYRELMTHEAQMILANGTVMSRSEVSESLEHAPPWASYDIEHPTATRVSADVAILSYTGTGRRDDGSEFRAVMSSTYVLQADAWRMALYQQTPLS